MLKMCVHPKKPEQCCQTSLNKDPEKGALSLVKQKYPNVTTAAQLLCTNISQQNILGLSFLKSVVFIPKYLFHKICLIVG